jgi:16S rRNA (guanine527-N7)-methyltransferase
MADLDPLLHVLAVNRDHGSVGEQSLADAIAHAEHFVAALPPPAGEAPDRVPLRLADLGSGGGLPGLVIAVRRPDLMVTLIERRTNRADQLRRSVRTLDLDRRVVVCADDVRAVMRREAATFDVVTARSFAAPAITANTASVLLRDGGLLIVSEPPTDGGERWPTDLLQAAQLADQGKRAGVRVLQRLPR